MNIISRFKSLPSASRRLLSLGMIFALVVALPLFVWGIMNVKLIFGPRAASGEIGICIPQNKVITVTPLSDTSGTCHDIQSAVDAVTGTGFTVQIEPGTYNVSSTINVANKNTINITGNPNAGSGAAHIVFNSNGWGFLVDNSTGTIQWLTASGFTPNGLLNIQNSAGFTVAYANLNATSSHTLGVSNSNYFNIYNTEIQSSAGALEIGNTNNISIGNNKIHNSANAVSIYGSQNINFFGNLIYSNRESGMAAQNITNVTANHNTFYNNGMNGTSFPAIDISGNISGPANITNNLVALNNGGGIRFNGTTSNLSVTYQRNDIYGNYTNYVGVPNQTGIDGNISANPLINTSTGTFCLQAGSPALLGTDFMGYIGSCGTQPPPTPQPPTGAECSMCGGIAGIRCAGNLICQMARPGYPDQSGICVKPDGTSRCGIATPPPTCRPRPTCLDSNPRCMLPEPAGGWCPTPTVHVVTPNGGEALKVGQHYTVTWTGRGMSGYLIYITNNLGQSSLIGSANAPTTSFDWLVNPPIMTGATGFKIKIIDSAQGGVSGVSDSSDNYFTISGTATPPPTVRPFSVLLKFGGVSDGSAEFAKASVRFISKALDSTLGYVTPQVPVVYMGNGIYKLLVGVWSTNLPASNDYSIVVKGEKHLGIKYCQPVGQTLHCSGSQTGTITIPADPSSMVSLDFTGFPLAPGDTPPQDGTVDSVDFQRISNLLNKPCSALTDAEKLIGDLDYNGCVTSRDILLLRKTLETRYDEN